MKEKSHFEDRKYGGQDGAVDPRHRREVHKISNIFFNRFFVNLEADVKSSNALPKVREPGRSKCHWDYFLEEVEWFSAGFKERFKKKKMSKLFHRLVKTLTVTEESDEKESDPIKFHDQTSIPFFESIKNEHCENNYRGNWECMSHYLLITSGALIGCDHIWGIANEVIEFGIFYILSYILLAIFVIYPLLVIQVSLGQFSGFTIYKIFESCPILSGLGISYLVLLFLKLTCITVYKSYTLFYFYYSFQIPWIKCKNNPYNVCVSIPKYFNTTMIEYQSSVNQFYTQNIMVNCSMENFENTLYLRSIVSACLLIGGSMTVIIMVIPRKFRDPFLASLCGYGLIFLLQICLLTVSIESSYKGLKDFFNFDFTVFSRSRFYVCLFNRLFVGFGFGLGIIVSLSSFNRFNDPIIIYCKIFLCFKIFVIIIITITAYAIYGSTISKTNNRADFLKLYESHIKWTYVLLIEKLSTINYGNIWCIISLSASYFFDQLLCFTLFEVINNGFRESTVLPYKMTDHTFFILIGFQVFTGALAYGGHNGCFIEIINESVLGIYQYILESISMVGFMIYGIRYVQKDIRIMIDYRINVHIVYISIVILEVICILEIINIIISIAEKHIWAIKIIIIFGIVILLPIILKILFLYFFCKYNLYKFFNPSVIWGPRTLYYWNKIGFYRKKMKQKKKYEEIEQRFNKLGYKD